LQLKFHKSIKTIHVAFIDLSNKARLALKFVSSTEREGMFVVKCGVTITDHEKSPLYDPQMTRLL